MRRSGLELAAGADLGTSIIGVERRCLHARHDLVKEWGVDRRIDVDVVAGVGNRQCNPKSLFKGQVGDLNPIHATHSAC